MTNRAQDAFLRGQSMTGSPATAHASTSAFDGAMSRVDLLRALVRIHQHLVEARLQLTRTGTPPDPQIECDLAAVTERITNLLSGREENRPEFEPRVRAGDEHLSEDR